MPADTGKMTELLRRLKREMNGAVADAMDVRGAGYSLNYGVSAVTVRAIASKYGPDRDLARFLYRQDVRELKLSAFYIADPASLTVGELDYWAEGVTGDELAQYLAFVLVGPSPVAAEAVEMWLASDNDLLRYAALMTGARLLRRGGEMPLSADGAMASMLRGGNRMLWSGVAAVAGRLGDRERFPATAREIRSGSGPGASYVREELGM